MLTFLIATLLSWAPETSFEINQIHDVAPSPDGSQTLVVTSKAEADYQLNIYQDNSPVSFEVYPDAFPKWSPDGEWIAYRASDTLHLIHLPSETSQTLHTASAPIIGFSWAPDSSRLAYTTDTSLHLIALDGTHETLISDAPHFVDGIAWAPDGTEITYTYTTVSGVEGTFFHTHLATLDLNTHQITPWDLPGCQSRPYYSPDGLWIAYIQGEVPSHYGMDHSIAVRSRSAHESTRVTRVENIGPITGRHTLLGWTDSEHLLFCEPYRTEERLVSLSLADQTWTPVASCTYQPHLNTRGTHLGFVSQSADSPPEACVTPASHFEPTQITHLNDHLPPVCSTQLIRWTAPDGLEIEGLLTLPSGDPPYPLVLSIHGGPMGAWTETYIGNPHPYPPALLADAGYAVLRPNPRGSSNYGSAFRLANSRDWGGADLQDVLSGVDHLVAQGIADPDNLAVVGWSYGGYLAAAAVTQTDRFKTASIGAPIINLTSFTGTNDIPHIIPDCFHAYPHEEPSLYIDHSPLFFAHQVTTPCLVQHGTADVRVPFSQSQEWVSALELQDKPCQFTPYDGMTHFSAHPRYCLPIMQENIDWLQIYLSASTP